MASIRGMNFKVAASATGLSALSSFTKAVEGIGNAGRQAGINLGNWSNMMSRLRSEFNPTAAATEALQERIKRLTLAQQLGVVSVESYQRQLMELQGELRRVGIEANRLTPTLDSAGRSTNRLGVMIDGTNARMGSWNRGLSQTRRAVQQAGFQINDFFLQVAGGQNVILAFTQQAGQLIQFFGAWGSVVGAALAIGGALWLMFGRGEDATKKAADALGVFDSALSSALRNAEIMDTSIDELRKTYGQFADEIHRAAQESMAFDLSKATSALRDGALGATLALQQVHEAQQIANEIALDRSNLGSSATNLLVSDQMVEVNRLATAIGLSADEADRLYLAIGKFNGGGTFAEMRDNAQGVVDMIGQMYAGQTDIPPEITKMRDEYVRTLTLLSQILAIQDGTAAKARETADAVSGVTGNLKGSAAWAQMANANIKGAADEAVRIKNTNMAAGIAAAAGWAQSLWQRLAGAASQARAMANLQNKRLGDLNAGMMGRAGAPGQGIARDYSLEAWTALVPNVGTGGGGGGGGGESPLARMRKDYDALVQSLNPAVTATRLFSDANKMMLTALADGSEVAFGRVKTQIEEMQKSFDDLVKTIGTSMMTSFKAVLKGTTSLADGVNSVLDSIIDRTIEMLMSPIFDGIAGFLGKSIFGAIGGLGMVPSFAGGGDTGNASRSGGLDRKGGFLAMMHPQESVIDHTRGGNRNGDVTIVVNVNSPNGNNEIREMVSLGIEAGLRTYDRKVLPSSVRRVVNNPRRTA